MSLYPLFVDLKGRAALVIGGGPVAERKIAGLLRAGAQVSVVAETLTDALQELVTQQALQWQSSPFQPAMLDAVWLTIAATDDPALNAAVAAAGESRQRWVNVVDAPRQSSVQIPSVIHRAPLQIAISTHGAAPVLARRLREHIESLLPESIGPLVALAQTFRSRIRQRFPQLGPRRQFYDWLHDGPVGQALANRQPAEATQLLETALAAADPAKPAAGRVTLVGAGPGDPGLLTLAALRALNEADIILHDALVSPAVLDLARRDATLIAVGKRGGGIHTPQSEIHRQLLEHARAGRHVVRLKGGDPFIFGRGGEEIEYLREHHIPYQVVPGITAALACAAYAGISLTHRQHARSIQLVTAHTRDAVPSLDWLSLVQPEQTLAIYMGVAALDAVQQTLLRHGMAPTTPFALIENGSRPDQRTLAGELAQLSELAQAHGISAPALLIIGEVAAMAHRQSWFGEHIDARPAGRLSAETPAQRGSPA
ncbi:siroheme synthase CysG [Frateuria aurantia]